MIPRRIEAPLVLLSTFVVLVASALIWTRQSQALPLHEVLEQYASDHPYHAFVVFQEGDCDSRIDFLAALNDSALIPKVRLHGLLVGDAANLKDIQSRLRARGMPFPVEKAPRSVVAATKALGYKTTPFVVFTDSAGRVRYSSPSLKNAADSLRFSGMVGSIRQDGR